MNIKHFFRGRIILLTLILFLVSSVFVSESLASGFGWVKIIDSEPSAEMVCLSAVKHFALGLPFPFLAITGGNSCESDISVNFIGLTTNLIIFFALANLVLRKKIKLPSKRVIK